MIAIFPIIFLVLCLICFFRESKVTALYKTFGVYGRFSAYITFSLMFGAVGSLVASIASLFLAEEPLSVGAMIATIAGSIVFSAVLFIIGLLLYKRMANKCPDFLRKKLFISMVTTALGIAFKIALFFIPVVWALAGPKTVTSETGEELYIIGGDVHDGSGNIVGKVNSDGQSFTRIA